MATWQHSFVRCDVQQASFRGGAGFLVVGPLAGSMLGPSVGNVGLKARKLWRESACAF